MDIHERIMMVKLFSDVIDEIEGLKERIASLEEAAKEPEAVALSSRSALVEKIARYFSEEEIDGLAFKLELNGNYEEAESRTGKARQLVLACERRSLMFQLLTLCKVARPRVSWPIA